MDIWRIGILGEAATIGHGPEHGQSHNRAGYICGQGYNALRKHAKDLRQRKDIESLESAHVHEHEDQFEDLPDICGNAIYH